MIEEHKTEDRRKSFKELSLSITEPQYREIDAISYSMLSRFQREGFRKLEHLYDKIESPSLTFGSIVDTMLTDGMEAFNEKFVISDFPELTDSLVNITKQLYALCGSMEFGDIPDDIISQICVDNDYYKSDKYKSYRIKNVRENCSYYFSLLKCYEGRTVITQQDYNDAMNCVDELKTNVRTQFYFNNDPFSMDVEKLFQLKFTGEYDGITIKCMPDLVVVNHKEKIIIPCDLKTTGSPEEIFGEHSFYQWRYFYQAQMYTYILKQIISKDEYFKDFKIKGYEFIVINRNTLTPMVWHYDSNFSETDITDKNGEIIPAWRTVLKQLDYYRKFYSEHEYYPNYPVGYEDMVLQIPLYN